MHFKPFFLAFVLSTATPVRADAPPGEKVAYVAKVPPSIRQGAVGRKYTRFFGKTVIDGQCLALHFYDTQRLQTDDNRVTSQKSRLDIYAETRSKDRTFYKRINAIPITYTRFDGGGYDKEKFTVQVEKLWLVPGTKTQPILRFNLNIAFTSNPANAKDEPYILESGVDALFIFPAGLASPAIFQPFEHFSDSSSYKSNYFTTLGKKGYITVYRESLDRGAQGFEGWTWDGKQFVQADEKYLVPGEIGQCKWDGEKIIKTVWHD